MTPKKVKAWLRQAGHLTVFTVAALAIVFLVAEDEIFPLAKRQPLPSASTVLYQWNGFSKDAKSRVSEWLNGRNSLLDRIQQQGGLPNFTVAQEVHKLNLLELDYLQWATNSMPIFLEVTSQYLEVFKLGSEVSSPFQPVMEDYRMISDVYPKILECQKQVWTDTQTLGVGLKGSKEDQISEAIGVMTLSLVALLKSAKAGDLAHCGDELSKFEEAYGRLVSRYSEVVTVLDQHAKEQEREKQLLHWLAILVLIFMPSLPEGMRRIREVF